MSETLERPAIARLMRYKRILDITSEHLEASLDEIASSTLSAISELIERVLEDYSDPADNHSSNALGLNGSSIESERILPDSIGLTDEQRKTLRAIFEHSEDTQGELADKLDVSAPNICDRVKAILGFVWDHRKEFVDNVGRSHRFRALT